MFLSSKIFSFYFDHVNSKQMLQVSLCFTHKKMFKLLSSNIFSFYFYFDHSQPTNASDFLMFYAQNILGCFPLKYIVNYFLPLKGTVSRDWIGPCIVLMDRPQQVHLSRRFSDFLMASSFFYSNNCSHSVLAKNRRHCTQLAASACKVCMQLAASRI